MRIREFRRFVLPAIMLLSLASYAKTSAPQIEGKAKSANQIYGAYWQVGNGHSSVLALKNNDTLNPAVIQLTLFGAGGQSVGGTQISIPADSVRHVDLASIAGAQAGSGGLRMDLVSGSAAVEGKVTIADTSGAADVDVPLSGGYRYDTENALQASWWLPDEGTSGRIMLFNSSGQAIAVSAAVAVVGAERVLDRVLLKPYASEELSLRNLLQQLDAETAIMGSLTLKYSGPPHALQPSLLLVNKSTGFSLNSPFNGKHDREPEAETTWLFPDVRLREEASTVAGTSTALRTYALLSNGTKARLTPTLVAYFGGAAGIAQGAALPVDPLRPSETRLIELGELLDSSKMAAANLSRISLGATHAGVPGDLGITVFSVDPTKNLVSKSSGIIVPSDVVDISYWQMSGDQPAAVKNGSIASVQAGVTLYYQTAYGVESYSLNALNVEGSKSEKLALADVLHFGSTDNNGMRLSPGTTFGVATLSLIGTSGNGAKAAGLRPECYFDCRVAPLLSSSSPVPMNMEAKTGEVAFAEITPDCAAPPTPYQIEPISTASQGAAACTTKGQAGWIRNVTNQVQQSDGSAYAVDGLTVADTIVVTTPQQLGAGTSTGSATTTGDGSFPDTYFVCSPACPGSGTTNANQNWTVNGSALPHANAVVYKCTSITIDGH